jgi:hypothetical protein
MTPVIRASSLDRILACPGSMTLCARVAPRDGTEAIDGTAIHWISHTRMVTELAAVGNPGPTPEIPKSVAFSQWIVDYYVRTVRELVPSDWSLEVEAALAYELGRFTLSGHIDCVAMNADATEAIGFDLKTGYDPVDIAEENWQVLGYAVLLLQAYPSLTKITFHIVQPRNDEDEGFPRVSSVVIDGAVLANATATLTARVNHALDNCMEVETSMKACKWCSAALICPAQIKLREEMKATITPEYLESLQATPDDAKIAEIVVMGRTVARPIEDAEKLLKERIRLNGEAAGIRIKVEGGSYSYPDPVAFYNATRARIPEDAKYAATVKPSMTALKEVLAEVTGLPKTSKKGESVASIIDSEFKPLAVQGTRERLVFPT